MIVPPRNVPNRDDYYMGRAFWASRKSKDPRTQVGAYIISRDNEPISSGYNGPPAEIGDEKINWDRPHKYRFVHHAEDNAIWYGRLKDMSGATIYVTAPPCGTCMLDIVRAKIKRVVYFQPISDPNSMTSNLEAWRETLEIAEYAGVKVEVFSGDLNWMKDDIAFMDGLGVFG